MVSTTAGVKLIIVLELLMPFDLLLPSAMDLVQLWLFCWCLLISHYCHCLSEILMLYPKTNLLSLFLGVEGFEGNRLFWFLSLT